MQPDRSVGGTFARWIAVAGGCGYAPVAPGTLGALFGVMLFLLLFPVSAGSAGSLILESGVDGSGLLIPVPSPASFLALCAVLLAVGIWAAGRAELELGHDDGRIVIDEVVGQLIALSPLTMVFSADRPALIGWVVTGFVLFRVFDIRKPGGIRWVEEAFAGGVGVMADDVVAGVYAALSLTGLMGAVTIVRRMGLEGVFA